MVGTKVPGGSSDLDINGKLENVSEAIGPGPWKGFEHARGYGVYCMPLDSGHVLALRVMLQNDFAPYKTVWHRTPDGRWSIYYDAPRPDIACPRYFGAAADTVAPATIRVKWTSPKTFEVAADGPDLKWSLSLSEPGWLKVLNALGRSMPLGLWRLRPYSKMMESVARRVMGMGKINLDGSMPSGHRGVLIPLRVLFIDGCVVTHRGQEIGRAAQIAANPRIGSLGMPRRPTFAVGMGLWRIKDPDEYRRTVEQLSG